MAKRSKKRRSAAQRAATRKMLAANKAKREGKRSKGKRKSRRAAKRSGRKSEKRVAAGRKAARTRKRHKAERKAAARKGKRKSRRSRKASSSPKRRRKARRSSKRRASAARKSVKVVRLPRKSSRVVVVAAPPARRRRRKGGKRRSAKRTHKRRSYNRRPKAAMENPMDGTELFIGAVTGLAGFLTADFVDRLLATHALTGTAVPYTDTPPTTGDYAGLFNATAICAPMNATRWAVGLGVAAVPLIIAHFIAAPKGRAALQFFGYAAGIRIVGKGAIDAIAMLTQPTQLGQQLYDGEMRASALQQGSGTFPSTVQLPSSGLGRARLGAAPCAPCAQKKMGAGYPSAPRQVAAASSTPTNVAPQPTATPTVSTATNTPPPANTMPTTDFTATPPTPPANPASQLQGFGPRRTLPRRDPNWGDKSWNNE